MKRYFYLLFVANILIANVFAGPKEEAKLYNQRAWSNFKTAGILGATSVGSFTIGLPLFAYMTKKAAEQTASTQAPGSYRWNQLSIRTKMNVLKTLGCATATVATLPIAACAAFGAVGYSFAGVYNTYKAQQRVLK